jgi:hypothetical protein
MSRLFDVVDVEHGDSWTDELGNKRGFGVPWDVPYDDQQPLIVTDICTRTNTSLVAGVISSGAVVYTIRPFGASVSAMRPNRCVMGEFPDYEDSLITKLGLESERAAAYVLYNGITGWTTAQPFLTSSDVATVSAVANNTPATIAKVLDAFYAAETGVRPVLHLGETSAAALASGDALTTDPETPDRLFLAWDDVPITISTAYPTSTVAVTGPVTVRVGLPGMQQPRWYYDSRANQNRTIFTAQQPLAVEFNASIAVRAT